MRGFKIFFGLTILSLVLLGLMALRVEKPHPSLDFENSVANLELRPTPVNQEQIRRYRLYQAELKTAVTAYFKKAIKSGNIVGAGVSIVKGDSILLSEGYGKRKFGQKANVDKETIFRLGSLSKGFTGVLAADLKEEGKLNWEDKVNDYLPQFELGDRVNTDKVRLGHILSHTSGTPYHSFTNLVEAGLPMKKIAGRFNEVTPISEPGEMYSYQNAMFALSGEVMYKATGQDINTLLQKRFFEPLGMHTANTDYESLMQHENIALPHIKRGKGWLPKKLNDHYDNAVAAGGINASASDMAKWMRFLLGNNPEVMNKGAIAEAFVPQVEINIGRKYYKRWPGHVSSHYGFGWRIHHFEDEATKEPLTMWHHGGSVNNFRNEIAIYPDHDFGICVLLNSNSRLASKVIPDLQKIIEEVYSKKPKQSNKTPMETALTTFE